MEFQGVLLFTRRMSGPGRSAVLVLHFVALAMVLAGLAGCGGHSAHKLAPVSGTVTLDGSPAPGIHVTFTPVDTGTGTDVGRGSAGVTDAQGKFTLQTAEANRRAGAVVGKHSVTFSIVSQQAADDDSVQAKSETTLPKKYQDGSITFDVPAGGTDQANFDIQTK